MFECKDAPSAVIRAASCLHLSASPGDGRSTEQSQQVWTPGLALICVLCDLGQHLCPLWYLGLCFTPQSY